jgi:SAM-dependent methyltransferase
MIQILKDILLALVAFTTLLLLSTFITNFFFARVPYVPSAKSPLKQLFKKFPFKKNQLIYDLGCGDGRFLIQAEHKFGIRGIGYEVAPLPYLIAIIYRLLSRSKVKIRFGNFFKADLRDADIIFCYLYPEIVQKVYQKVSRECRPGTKLISNTFSIKNLEPVEIYYDSKKRPQIYIYQI